MAKRKVTISTSGGVITFDQHDSYPTDGGESDNEGQSNSAGESQYEDDSVTASHG